jgi:hypothetical protein
MSIRQFLFLIISFFLLVRCDKEATVGHLELLHVFLGDDEISMQEPFSDNMPIDRPISLVFSRTVNQESAENAIKLLLQAQVISSQLTFSGNTVIIHPAGVLENSNIYVISVSDELRGSQGEEFHATSISFQTALSALTITSVTIGDSNVPLTNDRITDVPLDLNMSVNFSKPLDVASLAGSIQLSGSDAQNVLVTVSNDNKTLKLTSANALTHISKYTLTISNNVRGANGEHFTGMSKTFYTVLDSSPKFPIISDDALLTLVQQQTFKYFWDFAHPACGMARERNTSGDVVTTGGSGFGLVAIIVGIERNFITRTQGIERLDKILSFLETADRFHGAWPHWIDGNTGHVIPFSTKDNGGDLVETSFLVQGLLTFRQYLNASNPDEAALIARINTLWESVEWDWYRKNNENVLYWHWSPNYSWEMNFPLYGYFEEQITYVLAAASPTHTIPKDVYTNGYGKNGAIVKNNTYYGYKLPLESPAPLFWVQYSYLGMDPHFTDDYANYWKQNTNATLIDQAYCIANPKNYVGYSDECWGLTSSDDQLGYNAHSPSNDLGVITPTAALSSFPYTPDESMKALKFFYYKLGDRLWGEYGFYDAFNLTEGWTADSYLAIDQGPIIVMIENYRTGLLWDLFMSAPEVQTGSSKLGFIF